MYTSVLTAASGAEARVTVIGEEINSDLSSPADIDIVDAAGGDGAA
ncbi:MAG TPA: hypothetical protein VKP65_18630 [Rhodothermales bacterium]|nr:hypothetical protein [Rhodothermales bacterium]